MKQHNGDSRMSGLEIAITGMAGRFPGANDVDAFWRNLCDGVESVSMLTDEDLLASGVEPALLGDPNYVRARAMVDDVDLFDAAFFGFTPKEAEIMDPQQRLFLECAWEALERAGCDPDRYRGLIGVYGGASISGYGNLLAQGGLLQSAADMSAVLGTDLDFLSSRVSYKLNLEGPSLVVQTACSSSLVAVHLACQGLLSGECDMALAGGVSVNVPQKVGYLYQEGAIASPDGHCRAFDVKAQGTVGGSGLGIVVLKRLEDALADGDHVLAVIKGSAINNDGAVKVGFTAPRIEGQAKVISAAQAAADVDPRSVTYVEAHGTGTPLGDPIEIAALTQAFRAGTQATRYCAIGSVKTNIGHLDAAAGIAGLMKTVLALYHRRIPPSLHFTRANPQIDFENSPFYVNTTLSEWETAGTPRRAGVSSFGLGGTNAHVVLEEAPPVETQPSARPWHLLVLSAKTSSALEVATDNLVSHLKRRPEAELADVASTLQLGRKAFGHRRVVACGDVRDAVQALERRAPDRVATGSGAVGERPVAFLFSGQGSQFPNMGRELYETEPHFRDEVDRCAERLRSHVGLDLREMLYPAPKDLEAAHARLTQTALTQPALFTIEYALAKLWMAWGVRPQAMIGHSIGEYVAACLAGVFSLEDALALVAARGRLMQQVPSGAMLAVTASESDIASSLTEALSLAAVNAPAQCVVSGPLEAVERLEHTLAARRIECRRLRTSHAFHSSMMDPIIGSFGDCVARIALHAPRIPYVSNVSGTWITEAEATNPQYWAAHLRRTVRFSDGLAAIRRRADHLLLEIGPGQTLAALARQTAESDAPIFCSLPRRRDQDERGAQSAFLLTTLGRLWLHGASVDWRGLHAGERRRRVPLPTYPFERQSYWVGSRERARADKPVDKMEAAAPLKKPEIADWFYLPSWTRARTPSIDAARMRASCSAWLVFADGSGLSSQLVKRLEQFDQIVTTVMPGERFARMADGVYSIRPQERQDYEALFEELHQRNRPPAVVFHCWNVTGATKTDHAHDALEAFLRAQERGFNSLLCVAQAAGRRGESLSIVSVSTGVEEVTGEEAVSAEKATVHGACRVIPQEYPNLTCRNVDIELSGPVVWLSEELLDPLIAEAQTSSKDEPVVAYRGRHRWIQRFEPVRLEPPAGRSLLRDRGVYLVTGGLGGVGFLLADHLARTVGARLILTGRGELTDDRREKVHALERLGAEVLVVRADAARRDQMHAAVERGYERFGEIHGVIHAAGVPGGGMIELKTIEAVEAEFAPKAMGALVLDALFQDARLDFLVFCSSLNALTGGFGQVGYCAANAFLDAFAHQLARRGRRAVSINWDRWSRVGMAVEAEARLKALGVPDRLLLGMTPEEGQEVFRRVLDHAASLPQILASVQEFPTKDAAPEAYVSALSKPGDGASAAQHPRPHLTTAYVAPRDAVEQAVAAIWERVLGLEQVGAHDDFFELGGESLVALQILNRVRDACGTELSLRQFFEKPTVAGLAAMIRERDDRRADGPAPDLVPLPREASRLPHAPSR
ncbi:SDR family NAD(P)-dependent oxidoreductase [Candidatus Nitrospira bockiana]